MSLRIGTAGWAIPREVGGDFPGQGRHLNRYAQILTCAEINSSFHRSHRVGVYERWAAATPDSFRFAAKVPRAITHDARLRQMRAPLHNFLQEVAGLGTRLAVLLVQLPPSFAYETRPVRSFFQMLRNSFEGSVICEPRHPSWFEPGADAALVSLRVGRAAASPARTAEAGQPGGWLGEAGDGRGAVVYHRWHGEPRVYFSRYELQWLRDRAIELGKWPQDAECWCVFDNTASGAATVNALQLRAFVKGSDKPDGSLADAVR